MWPRDGLRRREAGGDGALLLGAGGRGAAGNAGRHEAAADAAAPEALWPVSRVVIPEGGEA